MIYNSRNYNGVLNYQIFLAYSQIYNSRNYNGVLNIHKNEILYQSTIVEIITEY